MDGGQSSSQGPHATTIAATLGILAWLFGPEALSSLPAADKKKYQSFFDAIAGGSAGELPNTILPSYSNLLDTARQGSFFRNLPFSVPSSQYNFRGPRSAEVSQPGFNLQNFLASQGRYNFGANDLSRLNPVQTLFPGMLGRT